MTTFSSERAAIRDALVGAGLRAWLTVPERFNPPGAFVLPGTPYISRDEVTFDGEELLRLTVSVVTGNGTNDKRAAELDALIAKALDAIYPIERFAVGDVDQPGQISVNGQSHLAASFEIRTYLRRSEASP